MKLLWVTSNFLHPTTRGGQIRTLEMLRRLHRRHEIHFTAIEDPRHPEGLARAGEYSTRVYPFQHAVVNKRSPAFLGELCRGVFDSEPVSIRRYHPPAMEAFLQRLIEKERFDRRVCDFLTPASYFPQIESAVLFQHNVETMIWQRHAEHAGNPATRWYSRRQAERMFQFERAICRRAGHIAAVSEQDAAAMRAMFGVDRVTAIPTGVDIEFFTPPDPAPEVDTDLVFVGAMDWRPNIDGVQWFVREALPLIRRVRPDCSLTIAGRNPAPSIAALAERDARIRVTGTVADIRPHMWRSAASIVPLRIGGGTRLKIYEAMAGRLPVVSTTVGAEGLEVHPPEDIRIADSAADFAAACIDTLSGGEPRRRQIAAAWEMVRTRFSWDSVVERFESVLEKADPQRTGGGAAAGAP
jgi:polysaccharide biosynthesis protein PslH